MKWAISFFSSILFSDIIMTVIITIIIIDLIIIRNVRLMIEIVIGIINQPIDMAIEVDRMIGMRMVCALLPASD